MDKFNKYSCFYIIALVLLFIFLSGCSVPEKYAKSIEQNIENDQGVNGTKMRLFLQAGSEIKSILSWEHFLTFKNFDIIAVDTGIIRAASVNSRSVILPGQTVNTSVFLDATAMGFDGGIFLCCTNLSEVNAKGLHFSAPDDTIDSYEAFNLDSGLSFTLDSNVSGPVAATFRIYGISDHSESELTSDEYSITFFTTHHSNISIQSFRNVPAQDLAETTTADTFFTKLLDELKEYDTSARKSNINKGVDIFSLKTRHKDEDKHGYDSMHVKTLSDSLSAIEQVISNVNGVACTSFVYNSDKDPYSLYSIGDTVYVGASEKSMVHASAQNAKVILANRLIRMIDTNYTFPSSSGGVALKTIPQVGPEMDKYFSLYSNISGLLEVLSDLRYGYSWQKDSEKDQLRKNLISYLSNVANVDNLDKLNPSAFSHIILWYSDYLLYAGLCSYLDNDFYSRYVNHHNLLLDEVKALVDKVAPEYDSNNIVMRFYAAGAFYDMLLEKDRGYLQLLTDKLGQYVDTAGEYGEGFAYLGYLSEIVLPVLYVGLQETYLHGAKSGQKWLPDTSEIVSLYNLIGRNLHRAASNWGELPSIDDCSPAIPYLAPYSLITGEQKYCQFTKDVKKLLDSDMYDNLESAEKTGMDGNAPWRMFLYPYQKSFSGTSDWKQPLDSVRKSGSIVQIPTGSNTDMVTMSVIAEENPQSGGTHDQIDHGAIQLTRYKNNSAGTDPHVDHLIIDPGYPGFQDNKRYLNEWKFCNQNVQMLWDSNFTFSKARSSGADSDKDDDPGRDGTDDEEFLGYNSDIPFDEFAEKEKFIYKDNGGMTGYRYQSPWNIREMVHKYVLNNYKDIQDNVWEVADAIALQKISAKTLSPKSGQGKSQVVNQYRNGAEVRIDYKYPKKQEVFLFIESFWDQRGDFYYSRNIEYEESHYGIRGVYTLGNNYFVIDHLPENGLPSTVSLATSWNMPKNTNRLGSSGWRRFVFEGTTPVMDSLSGLSPESRIELAVAGASDIANDVIPFHTHQSESDTIGTTHLTFENNLQNSKFLITEIRTADISDNLPSVVTQQQDNTTIGDGLVWTRTYSDNSKDLVVYNPGQSTHTVQGITSDAKVWLVHADNSGDWTACNLFNASGRPSFSGFSPTPSVTLHSGSSASGDQYEITF